MAATTTSDARSERAFTINAAIKSLQYLSPPLSGAGVAFLTANNINDAASNTSPSESRALSSVDIRPNE